MLYCIWKISCSISFTDVFPLHFELLQGILYYLGQCILYYLWPREILPDRNSNYSWTSARASCTIRKTDSWISLRASFKLLTFLLKIIKRDGHNLQLHLQVNFIRIYRIKRNSFFEQCLWTWPVGRNPKSNPTKRSGELAQRHTARTHHYNQCPPSPPGFVSVPTLKIYTGIGTGQLHICRPTKNQIIYL